MVSDNVIARMDIPPRGGAVSTAVFSAVIAFFVAVALFDLYNCTVFPLFASILSIVWLLLVVAGILSAIHVDGGVRRYLINLLAVFSSHHFVEIVSGSDDQLTVNFAFTSRKTCYLHFTISSSVITSVQWGTGQATSLAGRDMNDGHVVLWYHCQGSKRWTRSGWLEEAPYLFGTTGPKKEIAAFGRAFVQFLRSAGIQLHPTKDECVFSAQAPGDEDANSMPT